jgi:surfactin synthase thioesterase subunit
VEVWPVQLPGRENRLQEPAYTNVRSIVPPLADVLTPVLDKPFSLFGHSMGALVAFELARELRRRSAPMPSRLVLSARAAPHLKRSGPPRHDLPEPEFLNELQRITGSTHSTAESEFVRLMLPTTRADFEVCDGYEYVAEPPLACDVALWCGSDDPEASAEDVDAWRAHTTGSVSIRVFRGGHMFLMDPTSRALAALAEELTFAAV